MTKQTEEEIKKAEEEAAAKAAAEKLAAEEEAKAKKAKKPKGSVKLDENGHEVEATVSLKDLFAQQKKIAKNIASEE